MEIVLHLENHCIETAAKKKYAELLRDLLREENEEKERLLEFILEFIEKADFGHLRKIGFDGRRKTKVKIRKVRDSFEVEEFDEE